MKRVKTLVCALVIAALAAACKTGPPALPSCDGSAKKPINGRTLTSHTAEDGAGDGCRRA